MRLNILKDTGIKEILGGTSWSFIFKSAALLFGYLFTFVVAHKFGPRTVGLYNLSFSIFNVVTMIALLGFPMSILRFLGEYRDDKVIKNIIYNMIFISSIVAVILVLLLFVNADIIAISIFHDNELKNFLEVILIGVPFYVVFNLSVEFIRGLKVIKISETLRNSASFLRFIIFMILIFISRSNLVTVEAFVLSYFILMIIAFLKMKSFIKGMSYKNASTVKLVNIFKISLPMFVTTSTFLIMSIIDRVMIGFFKSSYEVGIYSVALKLATLNSMVLASVNTIIAPKFSELFWSNKIDELNKIVNFSSKLIFYLSLPVLLVYFLIPRYILSLFGKKFSAGYLALIILSLGQFINSLSGSVGNFLNMTNNQKTFRNIMLISLGVNFFLNYILIPRYSYNGAAIATAISMILWNIVSLTVVKKRYGIYVGFKPTFIRKIK